jgi:hypothetical protein
MYKKRAEKNGEIDKVEEREREEALCYSERDSRERWH